MKPKRGYSQWLIKQGIVTKKVLDVTYDFNYTFNLPELRGVLNGDVSKLQRAFIWDRTPQGHHYWRNIRNGETPLTGEDLAYLRGLEAAYLKYGG